VPQISFEHDSVVLESVIGNDWGWILLRAPHIFFSFFLWRGGMCRCCRNQLAIIINKTNACSRDRGHPIHFIFGLLYFSPMDHKAHRSAQSGAKAVKKDRAKGKEKQLAFNPKVLSMSFFSFRLIHHPGICP